MLVSTRRCHHQKPGHWLAQWILEKVKEWNVIITMGWSARFTTLENIEAHSINCQCHQRFKLFKNSILPRPLEKSPVIRSPFSIFFAISWKTHQGHAMEITFKSLWWSLPCLVAVCIAPQYSDWSIRLRSNTRPWFRLPSILSGMQCSSY